MPFQVCAANIVSRLRQAEKLAAAVLVVSAFAVGTTAAATASQAVRLWGYECAYPKSCRATVLSKPRSFWLGSHYRFTSVRWLSWNPFTASAAVTLHASFAGMAHPAADRTVVIFYNVKTLCGLRTYTRWVSGDGNAQWAEDDPQSGCGWYLGNP